MHVLVLLALNINECVENDTLEAGQCGNLPVSVGDRAQRETTDHAGHCDLIQDIVEINGVQ